MTLFDFLAGFWWILVPLIWLIAMGWGSWMKYKKHQANLEVLKAYAASGNEPPADLLKTLRGDSLTEEMGMSSEASKSWNGGTAPFLVILFIGLAAVFAYEGKYGLLGMGNPAYFVAMIMIVMAFAFMAGAMFGPKAPKK